MRRLARPRDRRARRRRTRSSATRPPAGSASCSATRPRTTSSACRAATTSGSRAGWPSTSRSSPGRPPTRSPATQRDDGRTSIRFGTRRHEVLITTAQADAFADELPGATRTGRYRVVAPVNTPVAIALADAARARPRGHRRPRGRRLAQGRDALERARRRDRARGRAGLDGQRQRRTAAEGARAPGVQAARHRLLGRADRPRRPRGADGAAARGAAHARRHARAAVARLGRAAPGRAAAARDAVRHRGRGVAASASSCSRSCGASAWRPSSRRCPARATAGPAVVADAWAPDYVDALVARATRSGWTTRRATCSTQLLVEHAEAEELVALSQATEADLDLPAGSAAS